MITKAAIEETLQHALRWFNEYGRDESARVEALGIVNGISWGLTFAGKRNSPMGLKVESLLRDMQTMDRVLSFGMLSRC